MTLKQKQFNPKKAKLMHDVNRYYLKDALGERLAETIITADAEATTKEKRLQNSILLGTIACMTVYEWGPGNEALMGMIGIKSQSLIANPENWKTLIATGLAVGAITGYSTGVQQAISGTLMAGGVRKFPETFNHWDKTKKIETNALEKEKSNLWTAFTLGTSAAVIERNARDPERTFRKDVKMALGVAALIGTANTILFTGASAGLQALDKFGLDKAAEISEKVISSPWTYLGLFAGYKLYENEKKKRKHKKYNQPLPMN